VSQHLSLLLWLIGAVAFIVLLVLWRPKHTSLARLPMMLDVYVISLPERKAEFLDRLARDLAMQGLEAHHEEGIKGKGLDLDGLPDGVTLTPRYRRFFANNRLSFRKGETTKQYDGHLGCSITHLRIMRKAVRPTLVLEDDAILTDGFAQKLATMLRRVEERDANWDMLLLGMCCQYNHSPYCKLNDSSKVINGIARIQYFFGGWAYIVNPRSAAKIVAALTPLPWHFDLSCADMARNDQLRVYACIPALVFHPGVLSVSSFNYTQNGDVRISRYKTDTNH